MRLDDAIAAPRTARPARSTVGAAERWSDAQYLAAAAFAGVLIASAPVLWAPPIWIAALLSSGARRACKGRKTACG